MDLSTTPIIFLDIDGVLQPFSSEKRFDIDRKELQETLAVKFKDDIYTKIDEYDVAAVWEDWNTEAVQNLKYLLDTAGAKIVLSTGWRRFRVRKELIALFRLHGLDGYITGQTRLLEHQIENGWGGFKDYESQLLSADQSYWGRHEWERLKERFDLEEYGEPDYVSYTCEELDALENLPYVRTRLKRENERYRKWAEKCFSKDELSRKRITLKEREIEILLFLQENKVKRYISLDDIDLHIALGRRAVTVTNHDEFFNRRCLDLALSVL